ncbi:MAG: enoyl-ACP reductase [Candidatus Lightella neohaematopini]|nr:enoyl-ACP reductase [Candidatus Lightella neohaematopini]MCV2531012.1 enoyl-ACP reductase [Candidatus Lightella neohaematopini]
MKLLLNKKILVTGISSKYSIAYGIAKVLRKAGAELIITCQNEKLKLRTEKILNYLNPVDIIICDVSKDNEIDSLFIKLSRIWSKFDGLIHSIAYVNSKQLDNNYIRVINRDDFIKAHEISAYSFVALSKASFDILNNNSSLITITYLGANKVVPNYNVMGVAKASLEANVRYMAYYMGKNNIKVNAISSGPIKTISSYKIKNFKSMFSYYVNHNCIKKEVTINNIGNVAMFLCSDLSNGITGEIINVDNGFNILSCLP